MNEELREKAVLTAEEVQKVLRLGKNKSYEFLNDKGCPVPTIRVGHQIRVRRSSFLNG